MRVQDKSSRVTTSHFVLLLSPCPFPGPCRLGVVASKKIGGAVVRNRAKRLLREVFRRKPALFPEGIDLVVIARLGAADLSYEAVAREVSGVASLLARRARDVRQSLPQDVRQSLPQDVRQSLPQDVRQSLPSHQQSLPQDVRQSLPQDVRQSLPRDQQSHPRASDQRGNELGPAPVARPGENEPAAPREIGAK